MLLSRRKILSGALAAAATVASARSLAHNLAGVVQPPQPPPDARLTLDDDRRCGLRAILMSRITAVQLVFTSCRATCPIQGAIFAQAARELGNQVADAQLLSLSIDPIHDDAHALRAWLAGFGSAPRWHAGRPDPQDLDSLLDFLKARASGADRHTAQAYFFNRSGALVMRSVDFPPAGALVRVLKELDRR